MRQLAVPFALVASLIVGCDSGQRAERSEASAAPVAAEHPQLFRMCTLFEVPPDAEIAPDGTLRRTAGRGNGFAEVSAAAISEIFASIEAYPGTRFVAAPAIITRPGERAPRDGGSRQGRCVDRSALDRGQGHPRGRGTRLRPRDHDRA